MGQLKTATIKHSEMISDYSVGVLMPVFNVEEYIEKALYSILNQTFTNLEIIIIDDCSTDNTYEIVKKISVKDKRIKLFRNEFNQGIVKSLNFGLTKITSEFVVRMDGDDLCVPDKIEKQLEYLISNPHISLVGCDVLSIDENDNILNQIETAHTLECVDKIIKFSSPILHIWMCRKVIYDKLNGYRELGGSEDYDFLLRLKTEGYSFLNVPFYGYSVRIRTGNTQTTKGLSQRKIVYYIRKLYLQRLKFGVDDFSVESKERMLNSNSILIFLHNKSVYFTYKALKYRNRNAHIGFFYYFLMSLISPYQVLFYIENYLNKYYIKKFNK